MKRRVLSRSKAFSIAKKRKSNKFGTTLVWGGPLFFFKTTFSGVVLCVDSEKHNESLGKCVLSQVSGLQSARFYSVMRGLHVGKRSKNGLSKHFLRTKI